MMAPFQTTPPYHHNTRTYTRALQAHIRRDIFAFTPCDQVVFECFYYAFVSTIMKKNTKCFQYRFCAGRLVRIDCVQSNDINTGTYNTDVCIAKETDHTRMKRKLRKVLSLKKKKKKTVYRYECRARQSNAQSQ